MGVAYAVADNGFPTGYLNNGKPITEDNVLELLAKAQKIWPGAPGWNWTDRGATNNHWYGTYGGVVGGVLKGKINANYACGGFAAMISDYLFGKNNNPAHLVTDPMNIRASDIIIISDRGTPYHVAIAATSAIQNGEYAGRLWTADGNVTSTGISWANYEYSTPTSEAFMQLLDQFVQPLGHATTWEVWSRYPD